MAEEQELKITVTLDDQASASLGKLRGDMQQLGGQATAGMEKMGRATKETTGHTKALHGEMETLAKRAGFIGGIVGGITHELAGMGIELAKRTTDLQGISREVVNLGRAATAIGSTSAQLESDINTMERWGYTREQALAAWTKFNETLGDFARVNSNTMRVLRTEMNLGVGEADRLQNAVRTAGNAQQAARAVADSIERERKRVTELGGPQAGAEQARKMSMLIAGVPNWSDVKENFRVVSRWETELYDKRMEHMRVFYASSVTTAQEMEKVVKSFGSIGAIMVTPAMQKLEKIVTTIAHIVEYGEAQTRKLPAWAQQLIRGGLGAIPGLNTTSNALGAADWLPGIKTPGATTPQHFGGGGGMPFGFNIPEAGRSSIWDTSGGYSQNIEDRRNEVQTIGDNTQELSALTGEVKRLNDILLFVEPGAGALGPMATRMGGLRGGLGAGIGYGGRPMGGAGPPGAGPGGGPGGGGGPAGTSGATGGGGPAGTSGATGGGGTPTGGTPGGIAPSAATAFAPTGATAATLGGGVSTGYPAGGFTPVPDLTTPGGVRPAVSGAGGRGEPFGGTVESAIKQAARGAGVDEGMLRAFAEIESGGRPGVTTGSYRGLFQLSEAEFRKHGGTGNIYDPTANAAAAARKLQAESAQFATKFGRQPSGAELYMIHQQGWGGFQQHLANPDQPAWQSMYATGEGRQKGAAWAKKAIWGNLPESEKRKFGSVENVTSRQFMDFWRGRYQRAYERRAPPATDQPPPKSAVDVLKTRTTEPGDISGFTTPTQMTLPGPSAPPTATGGGLVSPVTGSFGEVGGGHEYGAGRSGGGRAHSGVDWRAENDTDAVAMIGGTVQYAGHNQGYQGNVVVKGDDGVFRRYAMHGRTMVRAGQRVEQGQALGKIDRRHLHYEEIPPTINGKPNPVYQQMENSPGTFVSTSGQRGTRSPQASLNMPIGTKVTAGTVLPGMAKPVASNIKILDTKKVEPDDVDASLLDKSPTRNVTVNGSSKIDLTVKPSGESKPTSDLYAKKPIATSGQMEPAGQGPKSPEPPTNAEE